MKIGDHYRTAAMQGHSMDWTQYHPIEDLHSYLAHLQDTYDFVCLESIGQSHEGSEMVVAKVTKCGHMFHSICLRKWLYMQVI